MESHLYFAKELLYGAGLFTLITAAPDIVVELHLTDGLASNLNVSYPGLGCYMIGALVFTALVLLTRRFRCHYPILLTWILVCSIKFLLNVKLQVFAINEVSTFGSTTSPVMALVIYCLIFGMAVELMLHWVATCHMIPTQIVVNIEVYHGMLE